MPELHLTEVEEEAIEDAVKYANQKWNPRVDSVESFVTAINLKLRQRLQKEPAPPTFH